MTRPDPAVISGLHASLRGLPTAAQIARIRSSDLSEADFELVDELTCEARTGTRHEECGSELNRCAVCGYVDDPDNPQVDWYFHVFTPVIA